jgi:hypothetical protein
VEDVKDVRRNLSDVFVNLDCVEQKGRNSGTLFFGEEEKLHNGCISSK